MGALRRWLARLSESDEQRLDEELRVWAESIPGTVRIAGAPLRQRVKLSGMVRRITVRPIEGFEALEVVLTDGTGMVTARWLGRRKIPGLLLGSRIVIEGVLGEEQGVRRMVNPTFEFLPAPH
jgi:cytochrome c-type biogenesis protein CcmE